MTNFSLFFTITQISAFSPEANANRFLLTMKNHAIGTTEEDMAPPLIVNVTHSPQYPLDRDKVLITATVIDNNSGVKNVKLSYNSIIIFAWYGQHWGWGIYEWTLWGLSVRTYEQTLSMTRVGNTSTYAAELMELPYMTKVYYKISASDNAGNIAVSDVHQYYVVRGTESIIYTEVNQILEWTGYFSVLLIITIKARRIEKKLSE